MENKIEHWKNLDLNDIEGEVWRDIKGYKNIYQVSTFGRIKSLERISWNGHKWHGHKGRIIKQGILPSGYLKVSLCKDGKIKTILVHRIVSFAFIENKYNKLEVNHINGVKHENIISNLEWVTHSENGVHSYRKLGRKVKGIGGLGNNNPNSKAVIQYDLSGNFISEYGGQAEAARILNISQQGISLCCLGKINNIKDFIFKFKNE